MDGLNSREEDRNLKIKVLKKKKIEQMSEIEFGEFISDLWASRMWGNKDYLVQKIINNNGIDKIRNQFIDLLYNNDSIEDRFERFVGVIKGMGPASVTEILCLFNPDKYSIWNNIARLGYGYLKIQNIPLEKYSISGKEYKEINGIAHLISKKINDLGIQLSDLLAVDYFLWRVVKEEQVWKDEDFEEIYDFDHNEIRDFIDDIGAQLGFETKTEQTIARGSRVDVIWRVKIANLGMVTYVFEVHRSGSIDSLIINLQKSLNNPTVQKVIAVSDKDQIEKIRGEVEDLPENLRKALTFWEVPDVIMTHNKLSDVTQSIKQLGLVKSQFHE